MQQSSDYYTACLKITKSSKNSLQKIQLKHSMFSLLIKRFQNKVGKIPCFPNVLQQLGTEDMQYTEQSID